MQGKARWTMGKLVRAIVAVGTIFMVTACGPAAPAPAATPVPAVTPGQALTPRATATPIAKAPPQVLRIALQTEPAMLSALMSGTEGGTVKVSTWNIMEGMTWRSTETGELKPALATSWEWTGPKTMRFKLRTGTRWHNGEVFTADDVVASIDYLPFTSSIVTALAPLIGATARKVDEGTVDIEVKEVNPILPLIMAQFHPGPASIVRSNPKSLETNPVGTGPYKFAEWRRGDQLTLTRFDDYWGTKAGIREVVFYFRKEAAVRAAMVQTGEAHLAENIPIELARQLPQKLIRSNVDTAQMFLNMSAEKSSRKDPPLADLRVREAVNIAIDRQKISEALFGGAWIPAANPSLPEALGSIPDLKPYSHDPEKAKRLIKEAGATGKTLIMFGAFDRWPKGVEVMQVLANSWKEAGLAPVLRLAETGVWTTGYRALAAGKADFDMVVHLSHSNEVMDGPARHAYGYVCSGDGTPGPSFFNGVPPAVCEKAKIAFSEPDLAERSRIWREVYQELYDGFYIMPLWHGAWVWGAVANVDFTPRVDDYLALWEVKLK